MAAAAIPSSVPAPRPPTGAAGSAAPSRTRTWRPDWPCDVRLTLRPLRRGPRDPAWWTAPDGAVWLACGTPDGPATLRVAAQPGDGTVVATAWGDGRAWVLDGLPDLLGAADDPTGFTPHHPVVRTGAVRCAAWRVTRTRRVFEALVPAVLEQKVATVEAHRSWRELLLRFGKPAPGPVPVPLRVPPSAAEWAMVPSWAWHRAGVDLKRSRTIVTAARRATALERTAELPPAEARARLTTLPGIGVWTAAETAQRAYGDADAVSVGDLHLPGMVGVALTGETTDDAGMLRLLEPYRGQRYRAVQCIAAAGVFPRRRTPRARLRDYRAF